MKIGYPCINLTIGCKGDRTFRLKSYSEKRLIATAQDNLDCLFEMLGFNAGHDIMFFRITSDLVPFASHPVCTFDWRRHFREKMSSIGEFIRDHGIRISMHPDPFTLINSVNEGVFERSLRELAYHAQVLDSLGLDASAKIQVHVGGVYGDKRRSMERFIARFNEVPEAVRRRLVIENDDRLYSLADCIRISVKTGLPVLFDVFHHEANNSGETLREAFAMFHGTWQEKDGLPMVDYSSTRTGGRKGSHTESIDPARFRDFLEETKPYDIDIMLEIKDKERSAVKAVELARTDERFRKQ